MIKKIAFIALFMVFTASTSVKATENNDIEDFIKQIWQQNPAMQAEDFKVKTATAAQKAAAKWLYNPEIEYAEEDVDTEKRTRTFAISQTIDWNGKARTAGKVAEFELNAAIADRNNKKQQIATDVLIALAEYNMASNILELAVKRAEIMQKFKKLATKSFRAGDIDTGEYNLAKLAFSEALMARADADIVFSEAKNNLDRAIGFIVNDYPQLNTKLPDFKDIIITDKMVMQLPYIVALTQREQAAKSSIVEAKRNRLADPTIGLTAGKDTGNDMVGISLSLPINIINSYKAEVEVAKNEAIAAAKDLRGEIHFAKTKLNTAYRSYKLAKQAWDSWEKTGAQALEEQVEVLERKFKIREITPTDYLVQIKQAIDTEQAAQELYGKVWVAWFKWLEASGKVEKWIDNLGE